MLLRNLPHAEQSAEHVAAPQHDAPTDHRVAALGSANKGSESRAPIVAAQRGGAGQATAAGSVVGEGLVHRNVVETGCGPNKDKAR